MNREMKRLMQRQGQLEADGSPAARRTAPPRPRPRAQDDISATAKVMEFGREVRSELRQVAWPTRPEVANGAGVVFIVLVLMVSLIFVLNYTFSHGVITLLSPGA